MLSLSALGKRGRIILAMAAIGAIALLAVLIADIHVDNMHMPPKIMMLTLHPEAKVVALTPRQGF